MITKSKFKFFNKEIEVLPITVWQYIRVIEWDETVFEEMFWKEWILMCKRQLNNALKILLGWYEANELKSVFKSKKKVSWETIDLQHFFIIEWTVMSILHQSRNEIRSWWYLYFMKMYNALNVINWSRTYEDYKNENKPDKKAFKKLEKSLLNNK